MKDSAKPFFRYILILTLMIAVSWVAIPWLFHIEFPRQAGPTFDPQVRKFYINRLNTEKPDIVMLGDSMLRDGVDPGRLSELTSRNISSFDVPGSTSAFWYLVLKNNIIYAKHPPKMVLVMFRDTMLTAPTFRVQGGYFTKLDEFAMEQEPLLLERAFLSQMNPVEIWSERYFPLYSASENIREKIDSLFRYSVSGWLKCNRKCTDDSIRAAFTSATLEPGQLQNAIATAEKFLYSPLQLDFDRQVDKSFLPEIIRITKEHGIQLIFVRFKSQPLGISSSESISLNKYMADLSDYLDENNVRLLDYGRDPRLTKELFRDQTHLNARGETLFTQMLADGLNDILK